MTLKSDDKEKDFFVFLDQINQPGSIMDIGANIGIMTYHLANKFPDVEILAIEPLPNNFSILSKIIKRYKLKNVKTFQLAVGNEESEVEMVLPLNGKVKMQGLAHVVHESIDEWNVGDKFKVKCKRIDDIVGQQKIAGIKMDIENFEYFALLGAQEMLKRDEPIIYLELWENENRDKCFEFLTELNYLPYVMHKNNLVIFNKNVHQKQNFIFKPNANQ
ncbi:FkbM family methyltransferase [Crocinitomix catalasitica]|uniref:FkbM family methyltransferase n=1 Tax=Crocinitomix catalasitica TaxID=184607 RepID=UPI0004881E26|nr:FkbM family methyltransferase [Crocinitomix catalasitica]